MNATLLSALILASGLGASGFGQTTVDTTFTYQGRIKSDGAVVNGPCDFEFLLFDASAEGAQVGPTLLFDGVDALEVSNGLFSAPLDFGDVFFEDARWLEIRVRCPSGAGQFAVVSPRQPLHTVPFAGYSLEGAGWYRDTPGVAHSDDDLGLGIALPNGALHVHRTNDATVRIESEGEDAALILTADGTRWSSVVFQDGAGTWPQSVLRYTDGVLSLLHGPAGNPAIKVAPDLNVGIGTPGDPTAKLHVIGNILATGSCNCSSDARFKTNIVPIDDALGCIRVLRGVFYDWRVDAFPDHGFEDDRQIGLLAQEVARVLPEVVHQSRDGYYAISYDRLTAVLIEGVKELDHRVAEREAEIALLRAEVASQDRRVDQLAGELAELRAVVARLTAEH